MQFKGIDVSHHNGEINWESVRNSEIEFAIIRTGYGMEIPNQKDKEFEHNYSECKRLGIPVGAYHYSYAKSVEAAKKELEFFLKIVSGKQFEYPMFFDIEDVSLNSLDKQTLTDIVIEFCGGLREAGYYAGLYSNPNWLCNMLDFKRLKGFDLWLAKWGSKSDQGFEESMWQYSSRGRINGIAGDVDLDISYKNYPEIIKALGLNGFAAPPKKNCTVTAVKSNLSLSEAKVISTKLRDLGMTVL